jgi:hypothetical protein
MPTGLGGKLVIMQGVMAVKNGDSVSSSISCTALRFMLLGAVLL